MSGEGDQYGSSDVYEEMEREKGVCMKLTGSSCLLFLVSLEDASLISSIMLERSLPISSSLSDNRPASWYLKIVKHVSAFYFHPNPLSKKKEI